MISSSSRSYLYLRRARPLTLPLSIRFSSRKKANQSVTTTAAITLGNAAPHINSRPADISSSAFMTEQHQTAQNPVIPASTKTTSSSLHMTDQEFRMAAHAMVDFIVDYNKSLRLGEFPVLSPL